MAAAVVKPTDKPFWHAASPNPRAMCAVAESDDVLAASNVFAAGKLQDQALVERGDRREIETVEAFHCRKPCLLDAALDCPPFPIDQFQFGQAQQVAGVVDTLGSALLSQLVVFAQKRWQLERLEMMGEQQLGRVAHDAALSRSR
jgi:hypothetical protein